MKLIVAFLLVALVAQAYSQLQCYVCADCDDFDEKSAELITCAEITTPTTTIDPTDSTDSTDTQTDSATTIDVENGEDEEDGEGDGNGEDGDGGEDGEDGEDGDEDGENGGDNENTEDGGNGEEAQNDGDSDVVLAQDDEIDINKLENISIQYSKDPRVIPRVFRVRRQANEIEYRCYTVEVNDDGKTKVNRGCVEYQIDVATTCNSIDGKEPESCDLCNENECNASSMMVSSLLAIVVSISVTSRLF